MLVCRSCHERAHGELLCTIGRSYGPCEMCRKYSSCGDCQCGKGAAKDAAALAVEDGFQKAMGGVVTLMASGNARLASMTAERDGLRASLSESEEKLRTVTWENDLNGEAIDLVREWLASVGCEAAFVDDAAHMAASRLTDAREKMVALEAELTEAHRQGASDLKLAGAINDARAVIVAENEKLRAALEDVATHHEKLGRAFQALVDQGRPEHFNRTYHTERAFIVRSAIARVEGRPLPVRPPLPALRLPSQDICVPIVPDPPEEAGP